MPELARITTLERSFVGRIAGDLKKRGFVRTFFPEDDRRTTRVSLTDAGRRLREKGLAMNLVKASGLTPEEFGKMQKGVVTLRDNLIKAAQGTHE